MSIERAYQHLVPIIGVDQIESLAVAIEVERLRQAWKPDKVKVLLLAESHVWTSDWEVNCRVCVPGQTESSYARFVYCLGYGEPSFVSQSVLQNSGTWQYWRLFHDCLFGPTISAQRLTRHEKNSTRRVQSKIELLEQMHEAGIWLVDASVTALYNRGKRLIDGKNYAKAIHTSYDRHVGHVLKECSPAGVLIVGKAVSNVLSERIKKDVPETKVAVISQPNARLTKLARKDEQLRSHNFCKTLLGPPTCTTKS